MGTREDSARNEVEVEISSTGRKMRGIKRRKENDARVASNAAKQTNSQNIPLAYT